MESGLLLFITYSSSWHTLLRQFDISRVQNRAIRLRDIYSISELSGLLFFLGFILSARAGRIAIKPVLLNASCWGTVTLLYYRFLLE
ncbi:MAG: hypothetical protein RLZZ540_1944 [Bacteroidota bacterium]